MILKKKMVAAIQTRSGTEKNLKCKFLNSHEAAHISELSLDQFVTKNSMLFFEKLQISSDFLNVDPHTWESRDDFKYCLKIVQALQVINDKAERGVALITEYNSLLTKDESKRQSIVQVMGKYRSLFPDCNKETFMRSVHDYILFQTK